jgi:hypothetical protein
MGFDDVEVYGGNFWLNEMSSSGALFFQPIPRESASWCFTWALGKISDPFLTDEGSRLEMNVPSHLYSESGFSVSRYHVLDRWHDESLLAIPYWTYECDPVFYNRENT